MPDGAEAIVPPDQEGLAVGVGHTLPFEKPRQFYNVPSEVIGEVAGYMGLVITRATPNREVKVKEVLENVKDMFGERIRRNDRFWLQHTAASVREILVFVDPSHFREAFQNIPPETDPAVARAFTFLIKATTYLSSVVHFRDASKVGDADLLYPNEGYGNKTREEFIAAESEFLERVCVDVVYTLHGRSFQVSVSGLILIKT